MNARSFFCRRSTNLDLIVAGLEMTKDRLARLEEIKGEDPEYWQICYEAEAALLEEDLRLAERRLLLFSLRRRAAEAVLRLPWAQALDPPFYEGRIQIVGSLEELEDKIKHGNWPAGKGLLLAESESRNICLVTQSGGDDWLAIRSGQIFESCAFSSFFEKDRISGIKSFQAYVNKLMNPAEEPEKKPLRFSGNC